MNESTKRVDARDQPCPQPVVLAKRALEEGGFEILEVLVDNPTAVENVTRFAIHAGHVVESTNATPEGTAIRIRRAEGKTSGAGASAAGAVKVPGTSSVPLACQAGVPGAESVVTLLIPHPVIGSGDDELGALLIKGFIATLLDTSPLPRRIILMNGGVKLAVEGSASLDKLTALEERGVDILACGTCLDFYKLKEKLAVGRISNMFEIAGFLLQGSVLSI